MASNADIKQHISTTERGKWNKNITDYTGHLGSTGIVNHGLGNGTQPGFSMNDYTNIEKEKVNTMEEGALNNPHPANHPWTMITGLTTLANTASWTDLVNIPKRITDVENGVADSATVGGIRVIINGTAPANPQNNKEFWIDTTQLVMKVFLNGKWEIIGAAWR